MGPNAMCARCTKPFSCKAGSRPTSWKLFEDHFAVARLATKTNGVFDELLSDSQIAMRWGNKQASEQRVVRPPF